jgi:preprotein translocase subunit YajC
MIMNINAFSVLLAQQTPVAENQTGQMLKSFGMMAMILVVFWFLMIQPQRKKAKELETLLKTLKAGDKVITTSGIIGVVLSVKDKSVTLRSADTKIEILKSAVVEVTDRGETVEVQS